MILTPKQLIKQFFPEPIETTRDLYDQLGLDEAQYPYLAWLTGAEEHCLARFVEEVDYRLLPDSEKNYWINLPVFMTLVQSSPSPICDRIRAGLMEISNKAAADRNFARQLQDQLDQEYGIEKAEAKVSKALKNKYNETGADAFEFSIKNDTRLYFDVISGYNFTPGQKIKYALFLFQMETEDGIPYHIVDINLTLDGGDVLPYRTIWCCSQERQRYAAILGNRVIRVNLYEDNKKLVDTYEYSLSSSDTQTLAVELEKIMGMLADTDLSQFDLDQLGERILQRYNLNEHAYALAVKELVPVLNQYRERQAADDIRQAFADAINRYWEAYVLQPDPTREPATELEQMVKDRKPRVALALLTSIVLEHDKLSDEYFKRTYSSKQKQALLGDISLRLIYALSAASEFDREAAADQRITDMAAFITSTLDLTKEVMTELGQWPAR